ncbi:MAG: hypothetical protein KTR24_00040 [Saprospiraceae bacterium]|nr:hypothetical protein [Saprospiraceae bacterium]
MKEELEAIFKKITAIAEGSELNVLEKDLIKSYLLQAYRHVDHQAVTESTKTKETIKVEIQPAPPPQPDPEPVAPSAESAPSPEANQNLSVSEIEYVSPKLEVPPSNGHNKPMPQDNVLVNLMHADPMPEHHKALFTWEEAGELSDQLSSSAVANLTKALSINDRLQYQRVLFDGDASALDETLDTLNRKPDFESAKIFLTRHLIDKYQWMDESRQALAHEFVKLIARRFK